MPEFDPPFDALAYARALEEGRTPARPPLPPEPASHVPSVLPLEPEDIERLVTESLATFLEGFEDRLALSMQKALDVVTASLDERLRSLEEDQARILRHLGLDVRVSVRRESEAL